MKLPKTESLILMVFLVCIALWAVSKCSNQRSDMVRRVREVTDSDAEDRPVVRDTIRVPVNNTPGNQTPAAQPTAAAPPADQPPPSMTPQSGQKPVRPSLQNTSTNAPAPTTAKPTQNKTNTSQSTLYVTIDGLKLRKTPGLKGEIISSLALYEAVHFLGKKSEKAEEISLGYEKVTDHWVKVSTKEGKEGWVFGAGVHYYKMKRKGVME
jgi:hypothetical protein